MGIFISHESALEYWRLHFDAPGANASRRKAVLPRGLPETDLARAENVGGLSFPLHVMLADPGARRASRQQMRQHVFRGETPNGCFVGVGEGLMVSSPEFCFLQLADELPLVKLIELGYELCGTYSMPATAAQDGKLVLPARDSGEQLDGKPISPKNGFSARPPLTGTKKLAAFLARMPGVKGHQKAMRALSYISDGAASPMETKLAIILTLPYKLGGYHFPRPKHNNRIVPVKTARRSAPKAYYACDLYWADYGVAVEYDSDSYHTGPDRIAEDSIRRAALALMGITVFTVTNQQIRSAPELRKVACALASHMGKRLQYANTGFAAAHSELRKLLMSATLPAE